MILTDLPRNTKEEEVFPYYEAHVDTQELIPGRGPIAILSAFASTSTKYRELPAEAQSVTEGLQLRMDTAYLLGKGCVDFTQLEEAMQERKSSLLNDRVKSLRKTTKGIALQKLLDKVPKNDSLTCVQEILDFCVREGQDVSWIQELSDALTPEYIEGLHTALVGQHEKKKKFLPKGTKLAFFFKGEALHTRPEAIAWHRDTQKNCLSEDSNLCLRCGQLKTMPNSGRARFGKGVPGAGVDPSSEHALSWGQEPHTINQVCDDCWTELQPILREIENQTVSFVIEKAYSLKISCWDNAGGTESPQILSSFLTVSDAEEYMKIVSRILTQGKGTAQTDIASDLRIQIWADDTKALQIYDYIATTSPKALARLSSFASRFPKISFRHLVRETASSIHYKDGKWKYDPSRSDWQRWIKRLFWGTPMSQTEAIRSLSFIRSVWLRGLAEQSKYLLRTQECIVNDFVGTTDTTSSHYQLGYLLATGCHIAASFGTTLTDKKRRREVFNRFLSMAFTRPHRAYVESGKNLLLWMKKAYPSDVQALNATDGKINSDLLLPNPGVREQALLLQGYRAGDEAAWDRKPKKEKDEETTAAISPDSTDDDSSGTLD